MFPSVFITYQILNLFLSLTHDKENLISMVLLFNVNSVYWVGFTFSKTAIIFFLYLCRPHRNLVFSSVVTPPWWKSYLNSYHYSLIFESSKIKNGKIKLHKAFWEMLVAVIHTIWKFLLMFLLAWLRNGERNYFKV